MFNFQGKYIIEMDMVCQTGLHIGGITEGYEIGGMDNPVIKTSTALQISSGGGDYKVFTECPYVPGSSLKGKLRSLLEWAEGCPVENQVAVLRDETGKEHDVGPNLVPLSRNKYRGETKDKNKKEIIGELLGYKAEPCKCGGCDVCRIFGSSAEKLTKTGPTRLFVFDAFPTKETIEMWERELGEGVFTEIKPENVIDRLTSQANPRMMERVPAGSRFRIKMIYDLYQDDDLDKLKKVFIALRLLEDNSLGGSGSRGSGRVSFENFSAVKRPVEFYRGEKDEIPVANLQGKSTADIVKEFAQIFQAKT